MDRAPVFGISFFSEEGILFKESYFEAKITVSSLVDDFMNGLPVV
jgi:hypothetical protein